MRKKVVGMKKADYIAGGERNALVQGIIDASVRLADKSRQPFATLFDDFLGAVSGRTVDDNMLHVLVCQIGRAHVRTPVTNAQIVCRLLFEKKKRKDWWD